MALMQAGMAVDQAVPPTMASMLEPQAQAVAAPQVAPDTTPGGFTGQVLVGGQPIEIVNGRVSFDGQDYIVSDDGKYVVDTQRRFVGIIQDGIFIEATPELIDQLSQMGVFENEQPQGMAPAA